jgi:hypothetical protein
MQMTDPKLMKVSDEEREKATQQLSRALAVGRIDFADFEARIERVFAAQNYIELGDVVVDLPVRAPAPPPTPTRRDYLPINAPTRQAEIAPAPPTSQPDRPRPDRGARVPVVLGMGLHAAIVLAAVAIGVRELVVDVLPSASPVVAGGLVLIAVVAVLLAVYWAVATLAAVPRQAGRRRRLPPPHGP